MTTDDHDPVDAPATFAVDAAYLLVDRDGAMTTVARTGPPPRIEGWTIGVHHLHGDSPHDGELHTDGDELILVLAGHVTVELDDDHQRRPVEVPAGHGCVVPRGEWHRLLVAEPTTILHATPGPAFDVRWPDTTDRRR